nr:lysophospholipid acyltransferase family protein [Candidatus Acidoferrales bacterium]
MKNVWLSIRSAIMYFIAGFYFGFMVPLLVLITFLVSPHKFDGFVRFFCRNLIRLAGARLTVQRSPGFDPQRTSFFIANHVNLFDPFALCASIPQHVRGLELESHFKIPLYGILMKRFGNVPVPDVRRPSDLKKLWRETKAALDNGVSLIVFAEGKRTLTGRTGPFEEGAFRMAVQFGYPIVPVSTVGSFEFNRKDRWWLHPSNIVVHIHETIETAGMKKSDVDAMIERVHAIMSAPVDAYYDALEKSDNVS